MLDPLIFVVTGIRGSIIFSFKVHSSEVELIAHNDTAVGSNPTEPKILFHYSFNIATAQ